LEELQRGIGPICADRPNELGQLPSPSPPPPSERARAALIIAHPGHELRVHAWLESACPTVFVLTDGSGWFGPSRIRSTRQLLDRTGAVAGSVFGRLTDAALYDAILAGDYRLFLRLASELAGALDEAGVEVVAGDATEGYNPGHDVCRLLIDTAVALINRTRKPLRRLSSFDFSLYHRPDDCPEALRPRALWRELTDESFQRKLAAAQAYPELASEVAAAFQRLGVEPFRVECLRPVDGGSASRQGPVEPPFYERHGERQVAAGKYRRVLRYRAHLLPLARVLRRQAGREGG
jgi:hypothetical protein